LKITINNALIYSPRAYTEEQKIASYDTGTPLIPPSATTANRTESAIEGMEPNMLKVPFPETAAIPEWIEIIPAGMTVNGIDGRNWINDSPEQVIAKFNGRNKPGVIDWEHATEHRAPVGLEAPAAGWIDRLEIRDGAIWGHVEWTDRAKQQIAAKEYRFISPVFTYEKTTRRIVEITSVALTNQPNLNITALNQNGAQFVRITPEERRAAELLGVSEEDLQRTKQADLSAMNRAMALADSATIVGGKIIYG
jgi:phage I-like protein